MMQVETVATKKPQASREGKVVVSFWVTPDVRDRLKILAIKEGITLQDLLEGSATDRLKKARS